MVGWCRLVRTGVLVVMCRRAWCKNYSCSYHHRLVAAVVVVVVVVVLLSSGRALWVTAERRPLTVSKFLLAKKTWSSLAFVSMNHASLPIHRYHFSHPTPTHPLATKLQQQQQ
ncbi:hypothetical protein E2C01_043072 [Portunus trituberculatus]|uniref:Uncharacterized protein n=1 Tax=Portunus trituberculatus TaxID=210409 RepID=A0A5B7FVB6_PORTR|nr:hypothetical protein [Portunus trituberculatus]